jgi:hypothetical protein
VVGTTVTAGGNDAAGTIFGPSIATCPAGKLLISGGVNLTQTAANAIAAVFESAQVQKTAGATTTQAWQARGVITSRTTNGNPPTVTAYALCTA